MARAHRTLTALVLLGIMVVLLASLGRWQLRRADERRAILAAIESGRHQAPLVLTAATPTDDLRPWRPVSVQGRWRADMTVRLDNRNQDGRPGYWIATPLVLEDGSRTAVLVLRGWLPRTLPGEPPAATPPLPDDVRTVTGELVQRVPRLFELWNPGGVSSDALPASWPAPGGTPTVQNLDLDAYAKATGLHLLPTVVEQHASSGDGLVREWPQPSVDYNQNLGYAMQWFAFASIAGIAFVVVAVKAARAARAARRGRGP
ncbi:MAG TPA: SURF1 family protein [Bordetella sp.]|jgi:cytochrome oxidase assembly protein ShyY1|nr:SURF1 family protein [Bordetella sp.]